MTEKIKLGDLVTAPLVDDEIGCLGIILSRITKVNGKELRTRSGNYFWSGGMHSINKMNDTKIKKPFKIMNTNNQADGVLRDSKGNYHYFNKGTYMGYCREHYKEYCERSTYGYKGYTYEHENPTKTNFEEKLKK
ncbi:hypothetical protein HYT91_03635 [Candidatus Pacearchaeota archaeon]|nr:hypothetical protein [Candidatus Pacearchaeota archaeon]